MTPLWMALGNILYDGAVIGFVGALAVGGLARTGRRATRVLVWACAGYLTVVPLVVLLTGPPVGDGARVAAGVSAACGTLAVAWCVHQQRRVSSAV